MLYRGEVLPEVKLSDNKGSNGSYFQDFLVALESKSDVLPEIYIKTEGSGKIKDIKYFDLIAGDFCTSQNHTLNIDDLFPQKDVNEIFDTIKINGSDKKCVSKKIRLLLNNKEKIFETRVSLTSDNFYLFVLKDITEKKKIEEHILKLSQALDSTGDIILLTDKDGIITHVNPAFEELYGYKESEVIGKATPRILKSNLMTTDQYKRFWSTLISKKSIKTEIINKTKDGREVFIEGTADPIINENGKVIGFLEIQRDITERKKYENELKESEARFRSIWEESFDGMRLTDSDGKIVLVNDAFCKLIGMDEEALINKPFNIIYRLSDLEQEENLREYKILYRDKKFVNFKWNNFVLRNGKSVFFNVSFSYISSGKENLVLSIFRDVTKYKRSEEELRKAERLASIGTMAAYLSHEIKNPLATIKNYVEILFENENLTEDIKNPLEVIHSTVKNLNRLLTDVLQYARSEEYIEVEIDIKVIVEKTLEILKRRLAEKNISINNIVEDINIMGDYMSLISVFTNLFENSIDAVSEDGEITISGDSNGNYCSVFIQDNGSGVEVDKKIFEPFFTTKPSGTGLGLAIVDKIMKFHNGTIELLSSEPGKTIFELKFYKKGANGEDTDNRR